MNEPAKNRELWHTCDGVGPNPGDVVWIFKTGEPVQELRVLNPQWEYDEDGRSAGWKSWTIDGRAPTPDENDEFGDQVREAIQEGLKDGDGAYPSWP